MIGKILLSVWLILWGLMALIPTLGQISVVLAVLAVVTGILLLVGK